MLATTKPNMYVRSIREDHGYRQMTLINLASYVSVCVREFVRKKTASNVEKNSKSFIRIRPSNL